jgi:hypothetical protein
MTRVFLKGTRYWAENESFGDIQKAYETGLAGCYSDPEDRAKFLDEQKAITGYSAIGPASSDNQWAGSGAGKLIIPFVYVLEAYPGCWPGPAQQRGDCVSHSTKNAALGSMVLECIAGKPDEVTGKREDIPEVSPEGIKNGVLSTEAIYWYRRHGGDGWMCPDACRVLQKESGCWLRQDYAELGFDLTKYDAKLAGKWGSSPPTGAVAEQGKKNLCRAFAEAPSTAERRDALANGYFLSTCGGESYSKTRDKNGVSRKTPEGWAHAIACIGYDDRPATVQEYGCPLELLLNSWSIWNSGQREIRDSASFVPQSKKQEWITKGIVNAQTGNIMIPEGAFWALSTETRNRDCWAVSSVAGWPRKNLPDWGGSLFG